MLTISNLVGAHFLALMATSAPASSSTDVEMWAGHQITLGSRKVPFKGRIQTRTDTFVLARVQRNGGDIVLRQRACKVEFKPIGGVKVRMDSSHLPTDTFSFRSRPGGNWAGRSNVRWGEEDIDDDGNPGLTIVVDSRVCSGDLYVSNNSNTSAFAGFDESGVAFHGKAKVHVEQSILGARGVCLNVVAKDTDEHVRGPFSYVPVPAGTTCAQLTRRGWPVDAEARR